VLFFTVEISNFVIVNHDQFDGCVAGEIHCEKSMLLDFGDDRRSLMDMVSLISGCIWNSIDVVDLFLRVLFFKDLPK